MESPPKKRPGAMLPASGAKLTGLRGAYYFAPIVQAPAASLDRTIFNSERSPVRCCVLCGCIVTNLNLGGHDAPSAFRGSLWCFLCADGRPLQ